MNAIMLSMLLIGQSLPTADQTRFIEYMTEFRARRLKEYDALIEKTADRKTRNQLKNDRNVFESSGMIETLYPGGFKAGRIGPLSGGWGNANDRNAPDNLFRVSQVLDSSNLIVETPDNYTGRALDNSALSYKRQRFFVSGVPTKDVTDKSFVKLDQLFEVTGTKTYTTVIGGSSTIYEIKPFPIQDYRASLKSLFDKLDEEKSPSETTAVKPAEPLRTFGDSTGKFKVEARFSSYGSGNVTLEKALRKN